MVTRDQRFTIHDYLLGYGVSQKNLPLASVCGLMGGAGLVSMVQSPWTRHWHASRDSCSWPITDSMRQSVNFSMTPLGLRFSPPFLTTTLQVPQVPWPKQFK